MNSEVYRAREGLGVILELLRQHCGRWYVAEVPQKYVQK